jgi:hypothetical protein
LPRTYPVSRSSRKLATFRHRDAGCDSHPPCVCDSAARAIDVRERPVVNFFGSPQPAIVVVSRKCEVGVFDKVRIEA